jgi:hypothetical protein
LTPSTILSVGDHVAGIIALENAQRLFQSESPRAKQSAT